MNTERETSRISIRSALIILGLALLVASLPLTADAALVIKAKAGPVAIRVNTGGDFYRPAGDCRVVRLPNHRTRLVCTCDKPLFHKGHKLLLNKRHRCGPQQYVWIPGHFSVKGHGQRIWIPGHWRRI